jgi:hypothetical protein
MSSSGIQSLSSGPLIIRTYNNSSSSDVTYVLRDYDYPVSSNYVLITSTNGQLVPSNNIYVSSITSATFNSDSGRFSTIYLSSVFGFSPVQFYSPVRINNNYPVSDTQLFVNGTTIFSEPGAQSTPQIAGVNIWGLPNGNPITSSIQTSRTIDISEPLSKINFQLIGAGGSPVNGNNNLNYDLPGIGTYIAGTLSVKQGDKLQFTIGTVGDSSNGSKGTSLVYLSSIGTGNFISTLVCIAGAGGGNGYSDFISSSSGGGHGGGASGSVTTQGNIDFYALGTNGYDGLSTINGNYQSFADGGQGGQLLSGGNGGTSPEGLNGGDGGTPDTTTLLTTGGLVNGGAGGIGTKIGGYGGGGYSGGGGGAASLNVSAGGGGGATYIATSTLSNYLYNLVCLSGQWISQNNATPFGQDYGLPNNPGFAEIMGYQPNETLHTNGDINCRVLRYEMLDPPINGIGGAAALWSLYPAIDIVHMNDNPIVECGGIEVDSGGITVSNFVNIRAGVNDSDTAGGFMSKFIRTASSGTQTIDYQVAGDPNEFGSNTWQDARYVYNPANTPNLRQVWGIVTSSNITPVGSTIGDIHFYNSVYVDGNVGIGTVNPTTKLQIDGTTSTNNLTTSSITTNATSLNIVAANTSTIGNLNVLNNLNVADNLNVSDVTTLNGLIVSSITTNANSINIIATNTSTIGSLNVTDNLNVVGNVTCNTLNYTTLSPNVVTKLKTTGPNINISGGSGPDINGFYTGNLSIDVTENPTINVVAYDPLVDKTTYLGKYVVIDSGTTSISLTGVTATDGNFITFINNTNGIIQLIANALQVNIFQNTLQTAIYFSTWILPQYYSPPPLYILINNVDANTTLYYATLRDYSKLDYIIVGGGGGGGGAVYIPDETANYGGGGGGSGYFKSTIGYIANDGLFSYNITTITNPGETLSIPVNTVTITINIGDGGDGGSSSEYGTGGTGVPGDPTEIFFDAVLKTSILGGSGGLGGSDPNDCGGAGGAGWNGGGGGGGGSCGGDGGIGTGGANGGGGSGGSSGSGGGTGGGAGRSIQSSNGSNAGGGGGAGTLVTLISGGRTGGDGGNSKRFGDNEDSSVGIDYSGAGGGGGSTNTGSSGGPPARKGGRGYAILYFHN